MNLIFDLTTLQLDWTQIYATTTDPTRPQSVLHIWLQLISDDVEYSDCKLMSRPSPLPPRKQPCYYAKEFPSKRRCPPQNLTLRFETQSIELSYMIYAPRMDLQKVSVDQMEHALR